MKFDTIEWESSNFICNLWLSRPERRNSLNLQMANELSHFFSYAEKDPQIRVIVLRGRGNIFCAGGDLNWMLESKNLPENLQTGYVLSKLFQKLYEFEKPIVSVVEGSAMGGAFGLIACSDFVVAELNASFCFSEVKLGLSLIHI